MPEEPLTGGIPGAEACGPGVACASFANERARETPGDAGGDLTLLEVEEGA